MLKISMNPMQLPKILPTKASCVARATGLTLRASGAPTRVFSFSYPAYLQQVLPLSTDEHDVTSNPAATFGECPFHALR